MAQLEPAVHRTIVVVDIQQFTASQRVNHQQVRMRQGMYQALEQAFTRSGISWDECQHEDRGDGVLVLAPPEVPKARFAGLLPGELAVALAGHNSAVPSGEQIRLRMAVHAGEVHRDEHGVAGEALNLAFRLVDAEPLKQALANSPGPLALIVSAWFYGDVVRHTPQADPASFRQVRAKVKQTWIEGWIALPGQPGPPGGVAGSPYRGLNAFGEGDAALFFGRDGAAGQVLDRMSRSLAGDGLVVVSGASGAGKSSLLRAGVLARLRGGGLAGAPQAASWPCLVFAPGGAPLDDLALAVAPLAGTSAATVRRELGADPGAFALIARQATDAQMAACPPISDGAGEGQHSGQGRLIVIIDQFEQVFTSCASEPQREAFITALHVAAQPADGTGPAALVVLCVRADFEARCAAYSQLAGAVQDRYLLGPMTERQLRLAITEPARAAGSRVENGLVEVLLGEVRARQHGEFGAGVLPLLSHALDQAWRGRTGTVLTLADYERTGGLERAVAASAQHVYDSLTPSRQAAARDVFLRLTATSSDGVDTAVRATRTELTGGKNPAQASDVQAVLEAFAGQRLLTLAADTIEISHEVLLTAWPLLRDTWLAETHADRIIRTRLHSVATEWRRGSGDPSYLYAGSLLQAATETAARIDADPTRYPPFTQTEREFLLASDRAHRRRARRRQAIVAFLVATVIGLVSVTIVAVDANNQAAHSRGQALHERDVAISEEVASQSEQIGDSDPVISKLLSVAAWRISPSADARRAMLTAASPELAVLPTAGGEGDRSLAFSPDGKTLAAAGGDAVQSWDTATHRQIGRPLTGFDIGAWVVFSPDGKTMAGGNDDGTITLRDVTTRHQIGVIRTGVTGPLSSVALSPDNRTLAVGADDGTITLWDVTTRQRIGSPLTGGVQGADVMADWMAFSRDGKTLAVSNGDQIVRLWDMTDRHQTGAIRISRAGGVESVAFSPDGKTLATGNDDRTVRLWDVATRQQIGSPLTGHTDAVTSVAFSPDGKTLASGASDGTVRLWDVAIRRQISSPLTGHAQGISTMTFSPDGKILASLSFDGTVRLWDVAADESGSLLTGHTDAVTSVAFGPDGKTLASGASDGTVWLWDVAARRQIGRLLPVLTGHYNINPVAFSPDGTMIASSGDNEVRLWDVATRRQIGSPLTGHASGVNSVAFSRDGKILASSSTDGTVRLWDVATHHQIGGPLTRNSNFINRVAFSPDGKILASSSPGGGVGLWDVATRRQIGGPLSLGFPVAFSPDGTMLAGGGASDGTVWLWDVATRRQIGGPLPVGPWGVAFSPDGKILAGSGDDGTVRLWDVATHQQMGRPITGHTGAVNVVAFSPDGKILAGGTSDGTVRLWDVAAYDALVPYLCTSAGRSLTRAEWAKYVPSGPAYRKLCP